MGTLKPQSNGYSYTAIGTLAVDGWAVTFGTGLGGLIELFGIKMVLDVTAHLSTASVAISYCSMWNYNLSLCTIKG